MFGRKKHRFRAHERTPARHFDAWRLNGMQTLFLCKCLVLLIKVDVAATFSEDVSPHDELVVSDDLCFVAK